MSCRTPVNFESPDRKPCSMFPLSLARACTLVCVCVCARVRVRVCVLSLFHRQKIIYFPQLLLINQQNQLDLSNKTFGSILRHLAKTFVQSETRAETRTFVVVCPPSRALGTTLDNTSKNKPSRFISGVEGRDFLAKILVEINGPFRFQFQLAFISAKWH